MFLTDGAPQLRDYPVITRYFSPVVLPNVVRFVHLGRGLGHRDSLHICFLKSKKV